VDEMRRLVLFMHMSLDGYVEAPEDQSISSPGEDHGIMETVVVNLTSDADTLLLGRLTADPLLEYWLNAEAKDPNLSEGEIAYARWATGARKAVFSHTEETLPWSGAELLLVKSDEDMVQAVSTLKQQPGKNIIVHGGVRTAQALARLNLIDEYQFVVPPVALGDGQPLFSKLPGRLELRLAQVLELKAGGLFLRYQPAERT
jgi:dihydrofolate reductase